MKKILLHFLLLIAVVSVSDAQDFWQATGGPQGGDIRAIAASASNHLFAATWRAGIYRSTDNGTTWVPVNVGLTHQEVSSLTVNSSGWIFAGTYGGGVFRSNDNGASWTAANFKLTDLNVRSVASARSGEVFAGTDVGLFRSIDNGSTWALVANSDAGEYIQALIANGSVVIAGSNTAGISRSGDSGTNWTVNNIGNVQALAFGSAFTVYAGTAGGGVFVSTNLGVTWTAYNSGLGYLEIQSLATTSTHVFAGTPGGGIYRSSDNGKTWTRASFGLTNVNIVSLFASSASLIFAGTYGGGVFKTADAGLNWSWSGSGVCNTFVYSLGVSLRGNIYAGTGGAGIFRTTDDGTSWSSMSTVMSTGFVQAMLGNRVGDMFAGTSNDGIYRSTDNGTSWSRLTLPTASTNITSLAPDTANARMLAATAEGFVYSSTDRGSTWTSSRPATAVLQCVAVDPAGRVFVGANGGDVFVLPLSGNWIRASSGLPPTSDIYSILPLSSGLVLAAAFGEGVYRTTNNGVSWSASNTGLSNWYVYCLASNSPGQVFAGTANGVYLSTDNGISWNEVNTGLPFSDVVSLAFSPTGYLYAGTLGGGVYRTVNPTVSVAPVVTTTQATDLAPTSATLNGIVALKGTATTAYFEWATVSTLANPSQTPGQLLGSGTTIEIVKASLTNLTPGTTYYFRLVAKAAGGATAYGETQKFSTLSVSTAGSLSVTVRDVDGSSPPVPAVNGIVRLFDNGGRQVGVEQALDAFGMTTFTNVPAGSGYYYQVWHNPGSLFGQSFWGQVSNLSIAPSLSFPSTFVRNQPYVKGLKVFNGTTEVTGQTITAGTSLRLELTMQNPNSSAIDAVGRIVVDRDKTLPLDFDQTATSYRAIAGGNGTLVEVVAFTPSSAGDYYAVGGVQILRAGSPTLTDGMAWLSTKAFTVSSGLATPTLTTPLDGSAGVSTSPTFSWTGVTGATSYQLQVSTTNTFTTMLVNQSGITATSFSASGLSANTTYYWRVAATSTATVGSWTTPWKFTTIGALSTTTTAAATALSTSSATLNGTVNPNGSATDGWFEWGTNSGLATYTETAHQAMGSATSATTITANLTSLQSNTQYYFRVAAQNPAGTSRGLPLGFTTIPGAVTLSAPTNAATGQPTSVALNWAALTTVTYHVQVSLTAAMTAPYVLEDSAVSLNTRNLTNLASNATYYWRVRAKGAGGYGAWSSIYSFITQGTKPVVSPGVSFPSNPSASTDYRLVSFPGTSNLNVSQVLSGAQNTDWRIFRENGALTEPNNLTELSSSSSLTPGEGYWLVTKGPFNFSSTLTMPQLSSDGSYTLIVRNGWNIIGNPFDVPVAWSVIKSDNGITANLWTYSGTGGYQSSTTLDPFKGYYVSSSSTTLKIRYPFPSGNIVEASPSTIDWKLQLALETEGNNDSENYIGEAPAARESLDELDQPKPPRFLDQASLSLAMSAPNGEPLLMSSDFRPSTGEGQVWNFSVSNPKRTEGRIRIIGIGSVPPGFDVVLIDAQNTVPVDLRVKDVISFRNSNASQIFHLIVGKKDFVQAKEAQLIPREFELSQNYPNPFNPSTTITYKVPRESVVRLEVVSLLGRRLETLAQGTHTPGTYSVVWTADRREASGVYFARLLADGKVVKTQKMTLLK